MDTIRLLVTKNCNRSCSGCCNKDHNLDGLPVFDTDYFKKHKKEIKNIVITGGEPLLYQNKLSDFLIAHHEWDVKWIVYTAKIDNYFNNIGFMGLIDGLTLTFHDQSDVDKAKEFIERQYFKPFSRSTKSLRLNVFKGIDITSIPEKHLSIWKVKTGIEWIENCPLPKNEIFMRLSKFWGE